VAGVLFNKVQTTLIQYPGSKPGGYAVPNSVINIGNYAFSWCYDLNNLTIPNSVISIGDYAFNYCYSLTNASIGSSISNIGGWVFSECWRLTNVTIGSSVTNIGDGAFSSCFSLPSIWIPRSVTHIGNGAFSGCSSLRAVNFQGNALTIDSNAFSDDHNLIVYPSSGTTGWGATFGGAPTWNPQVQNSRATFGVHTNRFGFNITGNSNLVVVVQVCTNLTNPLWQTLQTNTLTGGSSYFNDPQWTSFLRRFYRLRSP
jgi:hypothetical protein